jgi:hypothetical protein
MPVQADSSKYTGGLMLKNRLYRPGKMCAYGGMEFFLQTAVNHIP